ncbi:MAG: hypothetical protein AAF840_04930 [Bacteroidota bacterium]
MRNALSISLVLALLVGGTYAVINFQKEQSGALLFEEYFSPQPLMGYSTQRSLTAGDISSETSMLRQGIAYHQQEDYELALVALRAYLAGQPENPPPAAHLLAATAAIMTGQYEEGKALLEDGTPTASEYAIASTWYQALLAIRAQQFQQAKEALQRLSGTPGSEKYPINDLLRRL